MTNNELPIVAWFSCGADSAVACYIALQQYSNVIIYNIDTGSEHEDNQRFKQDCEEWYHHEIITTKSIRYSNVLDVIAKTKFINSPSGAPCTLHLKKKVRYSIEDSLLKEYGDWDGQVFGFDCTEHHRALRFSEQYPAAKPIYPLIEHNLSKSDCLAIIQRHNIQLPAMYRLGYTNNNCIGCVKGGKGYWNAIRQDFPSIFEKMSKMERAINHSCIKDCFLDELPPDQGRRKSIVPECSLFCTIEFLNN